MKMKYPKHLVKQFAEWGRQGGKSTLRKYGTKHFSKIRLGGSTKKGKKMA